ncbi:MAG: GGDEF domain-containing protein [Ilumatobacter sp.]|jgi:diguanylate cyclase (GGDEF)-like protein|uniref:GGDEF domain-containing protein n=1 Tax=Ilumatobacter sp. TaxID=1967498 RepID=UPI00391B1E59
MSFSFRRGKKSDEVIVDRVTGAFNRRQLDADIAAGIDTSENSTATLMIDVDRFASYNGKKGAASGDQVLERVAWVIMATVRTTDVVYRHEASTFCVLLPSTSDDDAVAVADRIRANVAKMPLLSERGVTVSVGVSSGPATGVADAVDRALSALDEAVRTGQPRLLSAGIDAGPVADAQGAAVVSPTPTPTAPPPPSMPAAPAPGVDHTEMPAPGGVVRTADIAVGSELDSAFAPPAATPFAPPVAAPLDALNPTLPTQRSGDA